MASPSQSTSMACSEFHPREMASIAADGAGSRQPLTNSPCLPRREERLQDVRTPYHLAEHGSDFISNRRRSRWHLTESKRHGSKLVILVYVFVTLFVELTRTMVRMRCIQIFGNDSGSTIMQKSPDSYKVSDSGA